jgi:hypothetical protein
MQNGIPNRDTDCILEVEVQETGRRKRNDFVLLSKITIQKVLELPTPFSIKTEVSALEWGACLGLDTSLQRMIATVKNMRKYARNALNEIRRKHGSDGVWKHLVQGGLENIFSKKLSFLLSTTYGLQINFKGMI